MKSQKWLAIIVSVFAIASVILAGYAVASSISQKNSNEQESVTNTPSLVDVNVNNEQKNTSAPTLDETSKPTATEQATPVITSQPTEKPTEAPVSKPTTGTITLSTGRTIDLDKPIVAFTFDDGPSGNNSTERILKVLKDYDCSATFFVVGTMASQRPDVLQKMIDQKCEIGNHTNTHKLQFKSATQTEIDNELKKVDSIINNATNTEAYLVRPPWGSYSSERLQTAKRPYILWSVDTEDWKTRDKDASFAEVKRSVKDGYIILMHDIYQSTADAIELIIPWLVENDYQVVSVSELFEARGIELKPGHVYRMALKNGETFNG